MRHSGLPLEVAEPRPATGAWCNNPAGVRRPEFYYFECVQLLEKLMLTGLLIFIDQGSIFQVLHLLTPQHSTPC